MSDNNEKWLRSIERRFELFNSPTECAIAAAPVFRSQRWSWSRCGIPDEMEIRRFFMERGGYGECGRLVRSPDGRFGYQKPISRPASHLSYDPFDRKTFNPETNYKHSVSLRVLRNVGRKRRYGSGALKMLPQFESKRGVYVDLGCGDSPDTVIASQLGYLAYGFDLFPPAGDADKRCNVHFQRADVAERLPPADNSVDFVTSNAMIDLIPKDERTGLYKEVFRILKPGGVFVQIGIILHCGHGYTVGEESRRIRSIQGWGEVCSLGNGFRATKAVTP